MLGDPRHNISLIIRYQYVLKVIISEQISSEADREIRDLNVYFTEPAAVRRAEAMAADNGTYDMPNISRNQSVESRPNGNKAEEIVHQRRRQLQ